MLGRLLIYNMLWVKERKKERGHVSLRQVHMLISNKGVRGVYTSFATFYIYLYASSHLLHWISYIPGVPLYV